MPQRAAVLVADIGSTLTKLSAFSDLHTPTPCFLGQGVALTTVAAGDIGLGLETARQELERHGGVDTSDATLMAASSAAGGLRMTVHGLTRDMTLRAAREASLGAGAIVVFTTAGRLSAEDLATMDHLQPNLILLAGGVDDGDRQVVVANAQALASLPLTVPVIYAGNQAARGDVQRLLHAARIPVFIVENVYPRLDVLNIAPVRRMIQDVFARHMITAPGMERIKALVTGDVMPTPAAVLRATELLAEVLGDVLTVDVGGATTDVHSVTAGSPAYRRCTVAPEPYAKRTVEGDLGVYINAAHILAAAAEPSLDIRHIRAMPTDTVAQQTAIALTRWAVDLAVWRHAGELRVVYGAYGPHEVVEGRDLTAIQYIIGTGGALTRLGVGQDILGHIKPDPTHRKLLPPRQAQVLLDTHYIMVATGVLSQHAPAAARWLLLNSLGYREQDIPDARTVHHHRP